MMSWLLSLNQDHSAQMFLMLAECLRPCIIMTTTWSWSVEAAYLCFVHLLKDSSLLRNTFSVLLLYSSVSLLELDCLCMLFDLWTWSSIHFILWNQMVPSNWLLGGCFFPVGSLVVVNQFKWFASCNCKQGGPYWGGFLHCKNFKKQG
jgi:hypothetical protein